jgi:DNA-directed RNA polymerase specialized sigma24 family protein
VHRETLKQLLDLLGSDERQAAVEYRKLHERLTRFFEWNHVEDPMALADETIDRLGRRATEVDIKGGVRDVSAFALGVARHILQEESRRQAKNAEISRHWKIHQPVVSSEAEEMADALQHCLAKMQPDRRKLLETYYVYSGNEKAGMHQKLAQKYGLSINALRNRAMRARQELETSMRRYLKENSR